MEPLLAVVPWDKTTKALLNPDDAELDRYPRLAEWWTAASDLWVEHGTPENYNLTERIDYQRKLSRQIPAPGQRIVYTKSGSRLTAARLPETTAVVSEKLYWATATSAEEAQYLVAVLNSQVVTDRVGPYQSRGQFGARDFDLYVWYLPIPEYSGALPEHVALAQLGAHAEQVAAGVDLESGIGFQAARRRIREALDTDGVAGSIEVAVSSLLG